MSGKVYEVVVVATVESESPGEAVACGVSAPPSASLDYSRTAVAGGEQRPE